MIELIHGDCLEEMKKIPDESIDLVLTDPPYNIARDNNFHTMGRAGIDFGEWDTDGWRTIPKWRRNLYPTLIVNK